MARSMLNTIKMGCSTVSSATKENNKPLGSKKSVIMDELVHCSPEKKFAEQL